MKFYTNVQLIGNKFLVRGYDNGEHVQFRDDYNPTLFVPTKNDAIPMSTEWVVTLVEPVDKLKEMYETEVLNKFKDVLKTRQEEEEANASQSSGADEQTDSSKSD